MAPILEGIEESTTKKPGAEGAIKISRRTCATADSGKNSNKLALALSGSKVKTLSKSRTDLRGSCNCLLMISNALLLPLLSLPLTFPLVFTLLVIMAERDLVQSELPWQHFLSIRLKKLSSQDMSG